MAQLSKISQAILTNYGSLWQIAPDFQASGNKSVNLFRVLSCLLYRWRELRSSGEDLQGLVARIKGGGPGQPQQNSNEFPIMDLGVTVVALAG